MTELKLKKNISVLYLEQSNDMTLLYLGCNIAHMHRCSHISVSRSHLKTRL